MKRISTHLDDHPIDGVPSVPAFDQGRPECGQQDAGHRVRQALHPVARMGEISDIAEAVVYLENAGFVSGEILHVEGGQSAGH